MTDPNLLILIYAFGALATLAIMVWSNVEMPPEHRWPVLGMFTLPLVWPLVLVLAALGALIEML